MKEPPKGMPKQTRPDIWFCYRTSPAISSWNAPEVAERVAEFPFTVAFAYTMDETNHMAYDILLPDATDSESLQLIRIGATKFSRISGATKGRAIRQPAVDPVVDCRDMTDIATALAEEAGILEAYNDAINRGAAGIGLRRKGYDYALDPTSAHDRDTIWDAVCKAASHDTSAGQEIHDLERFEKGYMLTDFRNSDCISIPWRTEPAVPRCPIRNA